MDLLEKEFDLITPYGSDNKKLKDFAKRLGRGVATAKRYIDNNQSYF